MIPEDILSACPHRQLHTLPGILDSRAALSTSYPNACVPMQGSSLYHFYDGLWWLFDLSFEIYLHCKARARFSVRNTQSLLQICGF